MKQKQNQSKSAAKASPWQTTSENLVRYVPSGTYYARVRSGGKLIRKSLKTDVLSVAKMRLADFAREARVRTAAAGAVVRGKLTFREAVEIHRENVAGDIDLKPRTRDYHEQRITALLKSWPELESKKIRDVSKADCLKWAARFGKTASPTAFNHTVGILRGLFEIGIECGARYDNPAKAISRAKEREKDLVLPEPDQFHAFVTEIERGCSRDSRNCADLVRFLAFGGFRKSEAANITKADCDLVRGEIIVRGDPETGTKNWTIRRVPIIADMRQLLDRLFASRADMQPTDPVMNVRECQGAMDRAAKAIGMARITHHDLRHLFATRCIESGVDIPTVAQWLGHKDKGALAMKVYGHLRADHSANMAAKVTFATKQPENVVKLEKREVA